MASATVSPCIHDDLEDIGQVEHVALSRQVVDDLQDAGGLLGPVVVLECRGDGDCARSGLERAHRTGRNFGRIIDVGQSSVAVGIDVSAHLRGEVQDGAGIPRRITADRIVRDGVFDVAANVAQGVDDLQASAAAVSANADHHSLGELAGRHGPARIVVLRKLVVVVGRRVAGAEPQRGQRKQQPAEHREPKAPPRTVFSAGPRIGSRELVATGWGTAGRRTRGQRDFDSSTWTTPTFIVQGFRQGLPSEYTKGRLPRSPACGGLVLASNLA